MNQKLESEDIIGYTGNLLDYSAGSRFLGIQVGTLRKWVCARSVPFVRINSRLVRFVYQDLVDFVESRKVRVEGVKK